MSKFDDHTDVIVSGCYYPRVQRFRYILRKNEEKSRSDGNILELVTIIFIKLEENRKVRKIA